MPDSTAPPRLRVPGAPLTFEPHTFARPRPNGHKRPPSGQRFHLWVSGCQMNESDADYLTQGMTAYVPAIFGCNEVCSFCIVPFVRGIERSRPLDDVVEDVRRFARQGVREVTLLGQTINSYRDPESGARLADLLGAVERLPGIWRVRFLTSHPRHVHDDLLFAIRDLPRVCEHLHLPFQSGDDAILKQ